jgi:hypothetical protein
MNKQVAIVCNGTIPGCGLPTGAQGIRAQGLYLGLTAAGLDVDIISATPAVLNAADRWRDFTVKVPNHWRCTAASQLEHGLPNTDYDTVIFMNWGALKRYSKPKGQHLIYDFFSPSLVEHSFMSTDEELKTKQERKLALLEQADTFIANGVGRAEYATDFLNHNLASAQKVHSIPLGVPWMGKPGIEGERLRVFFGGYDQAWAEGLSLEQLDEVAEDLDIEVHIIGKGTGLHRLEDISLPTIQLSDRLVIHPVSDFDTYCMINRHCHVSVDIYARNVERELSYSTRAVNSLANGCPVITMAFTEIGTLISQYNAGWTIESYSQGALTDLLREIKNTSSSLAEKKCGARSLWEICIDPIRQIRPLADIIYEH